MCLLRKLFRLKQYLRFVLQINLTKWLFYVQFYELRKYIVRKNKPQNRQIRKSGILRNLCFYVIIQTKYVYTLTQCSTYNNKVKSNLKKKHLWFQGKKKKKKKFSFLSLFFEEQTSCENKPRLSPRDLILFTEIEKNENWIKY